MDDNFLNIKEKMLNHLVRLNYLFLTAENMHWHLISDIKVPGEEFKQDKLNISSKIMKEIEPMKMQQ